MYIHSLRLFHFRNIAQAEIEFSPEINVIYGQNGQGKTNLLEAISLLASPRSFRTHSLQDCIENGEEGASVYGEIHDKEEERKLGIVLHRKKPKEVFLNDKPLKNFSDSFGKLSSVLFSPDDLELVKSGAQERRKFLDRYLSELHESYFRSLMHYQKALKSKSLLLSSGRAGDQELESWNALLAEYAAPIIRQRQAFLLSVSQKCSSLHARFGQEDGKLEVSYQRSIPETEKNLISFFSKHLAREKFMRRTLVGPQRDDMSIFLSDRLAKEHASQGQTRSIVLAMKLAVLEILEEEKGSSPIVLLDDLESELDEQRRKLLFAELLKRKRQIVITGTEIPKALRDERERENISFFSCKAGKYEEIKKSMVPIS